MESIIKRIEQEISALTPILREEETGVVRTTGDGIAEIDGLEGVEESAVIGVPHPDFGEGVTAVVTTANGQKIDEESVLAALKQRLANYKLPKRILFVDSLPRNAMGKVQKAVLRERYHTLYRS